MPKADFGAEELRIELTGPLCWAQDIRRSNVAFTDPERPTREETKHESQRCEGHRNPPMETTNSAPCIGQNFGRDFGIEVSSGIRLSLDARSFLQ